MRCAPYICPNGPRCQPSCPSHPPPSQRKLSFLADCHFLSPKVRILQPGVERNLIQLNRISALPCSYFYDRKGNKNSVDETIVRKLHLMRIVDCRCIHWM